MNPHRAFSQCGAGSLFVKITSSAGSLAFLHYRRIWSITSCESVYRLHASKIERGSLFQTFIMDPRHQVLLVIGRSMGRRAVLFTRALTCVGSGPCRLYANCRLCRLRVHHFARLYGPYFAYKSSTRKRVLCWFSVVCSLHFNTWWPAALIM